ncbi:Uncharacterised protein [Mycobacterium tuberculosis]|uniref:Uncharacterized protein n=1 Tax=Mycobacterium tuberculosis TaxID=1773 RepID=A0A654ZI46_MYCTX|nr:Uncharacterised protein [Mycobacterium tuberculosis]CFS15995.1 Uncharacterised protein [Mycobacterium tuberculosis]CKP57724.1 Uncharacterised protein [Mycobacterium tuberculosis]CKU10655.1 Uncharacterised protein [Mycobacterium tuberculosis]CMM95252.1 Uncharacterised protein [Mycobacterium tuberculosis]
MIADQHRLADLKVRPQPTGGVGEHHNLRPCRTGRPNRMHDVAQVVSLVGVDATGQHQHPVRTDGHGQ